MAIQGPATAAITQGPPCPVTASMPQTMAVWVYGVSGSGTNYFFEIKTDPGGGNISMFDPHIVFSGGLLQFGTNTVVNSAGAYDYAGSSNFPTGWTHYCQTIIADAGTQTFQNGLRLYINGSYVAPGFTNSTVLSPFSTNTALSTMKLIPGSASGTTTLAYPAVWNSILSDAQIASLAAQTDPRTVSPGTLQSFAFLNTASGSFNDSINGLPWVISGGPLTVVADPFTLSAMVPTRPGSVIPSATSVDTLFYSLYPNRSSNLGTPAYLWSDPTTVMGKWSDGSMMTMRFEARPIAPAVLAL